MGKSISLITRLSAVFLVIAFITSGCGPTKQEIAAREAARLAAEQELMKLRSQLREHAEERRNAGEQEPTRPMDPGYPVANCVQPKDLPEDTAFINFNPGLGGLVQFICGNTNAGKQIVAWRSWYCKGCQKKYSCIAGRWVKGEPTFRGVLSYTFETGYEDFSFLFKPYYKK